MLYAQFGHSEICQSPIKVISRSGAAEKLTAKNAKFLEHVKHEGHEEQE